MKELESHQSSFVFEISFKNIFACILLPLCVCIFVFVCPSELEPPFCHICHQFLFYLTCKLLKVDSILIHLNILSSEARDKKSTYKNDGAIVEGTCGLDYLGKAYHLPILIGLTLIPLTKTVFWLSSVRKLPNSGIGRTCHLSSLFDGLWEWEFISGVTFFHCL